MSSSQPSNSQLVGTRPGAALTTTRAQSSDDVKELENTIACFQAILSDDERIQLQQLKRTSHDAQSIITFTAELDRLDGKRRGRSVASRLASFLQTVEQFTPIIDTYVQSNPDITALIWGSIKLTFMFLANFTSYFQSFVELLHGFGTLCTRFADYRMVFKDSPRLRTSICKFHTAIVTCCQKIIVAIRQPLTSKLLNALTKSFQTELRGYTEDIRTKAENVQAEIGLTKAQYDQQKRFRLLRDLSSYDFTSALNRTRNKRHLGTAEWVFKTPEFQEWANSNQSSVLHLTGKIGSGKTVLTSSIVEKLSQARPPQQFVSFFFLQFNDSVSLDTDTIIRSCVQQFLSTVSIDDSDSDKISDLDERVQQAKSSMFSREQLLELYSTASQLVNEWFIIIDGLDECTNSQQLSLLEFFKGVESLSQPRCIKMLFSSREACSKTISQIFPASTRLVTGRQETSSDISVYVEDIIIDKISTGELAVYDPKLIHEIADTIASKEQGMFLWAFLTIEDVCSGKNDKEIRQALQEIPSELPGTFDRALRRIVQRRNQEIAKKTFSWTKAVLRPLTLPQLREALSIEIGQQTFHHDSLINGIDRLPNWCENLVYVEETDNTVRFSHISVQEYLLKEVSGEFQSFHIEAGQCDLLVGEVCITYVNLSNFHDAGTERNSNVREPPPSTLDMSQIAKTTVESAVKGNFGTRMGRLAKRIVKPSSSSKTSTNDALATFYSAPTSQKKNIEYRFLEYATDHWFKHTTHLSSERNATTWGLLGQTIWKPPGLSWGEGWHDWIMMEEPVSGSETDGFIGVRDLDHGDFVREIAFGIAHGISFLPPLEANGTRELCKCANIQDLVLQEDFCNILATGYRRDEERHIQAFAYLACSLQFDAPITLRQLSETCELEASVLLGARTSSGKSLLDVLVRRFTWDWTTFESRQVSANIAELLGGRIETFFCIQFKAEAIPELESPFLDVQTDDLAEGQLLIHFDRRGFFRLSKDIVKEIFLIDMSGSSYYFSNSCIDQIVTLFFKQSSGSGIPEIYEEVFRGSLTARSWSLAAALIKLRAYFPVSQGNCGNVDDIALALRCKDCRRFNEEYEEQGEEAIPAVYSIYKLCAAHIDRLVGVVLVEGCMVTEKSLWFMKGPVYSFD
ncbi:hypothetical protein HG530_002714 [Fusarium avenaceum]|nr:hypothetical protein HG530_002714 [Fusarium avenaceum]